MTEDRFLRECWLTAWYFNLVDSRASRRRLRQLTNWRGVPNRFVRDLGRPSENKTGERWSKAWSVVPTFLLAATLAVYAYQAELMRQQLTASNRNGSIQEVMSGIRSACRLFEVPELPQFQVLYDGHKFSVSRGVITPISPEQRAKLTNVDHQASQIIGNAVGYVSLWIENSRAQDWTIISAGLTQLLTAHPVVHTGTDEELFMWLAEVQASCRPATSDRLMRWVRGELPAAAVIHTPRVEFH